MSAGAEHLYIWEGLFVLVVPLVLKPSSEFARVPRVLYTRGGELGVEKKTPILL